MKVRVIHVLAGAALISSLMYLAMIAAICLTVIGGTK